MAKDWGVARFRGMGSMEYLLDTGAWLRDSDLFDGAAVRLFESMAAADEFAAQLNQEEEPHGVQFLIDAKGAVVTWKTARKTATKRARRGRGKSG